MKNIYCLILLLPVITKANNIVVSNVMLVNQDAVNNIVFVQFDLNWDNSWRVNTAPANYDAAWVFVKYRTTGGNWQHVNLNYVNGSSDGHFPPSGISVQTAEGGAGCMVYRSGVGSGSLNIDEIKLRWNYPLNIDDDEYIEIKVFAIEMVFVPQGSFYLGSGSGTEINKFYSYPYSSINYLVSSENAINVGTTSGYLYYNSTLGDAGDLSGPIPEEFSKGYNAFYCMKYEFTQGQYVDFFNMLTDTQKTSNDITGPDGKSTDSEVDGNTVSWAGGSNLATTTTPDRACNYLHAKIILAYMDWSGLRPMTELEYVKACRGPLTPVPEEFAWGTTDIHASGYTIMNSNTPQEIISNPGINIGNANYSSTGLSTPKRVGIMAASAVNKNREETGATYYGIMEMSGNLYERSVTVGNPSGRSFKGSHGNGIISTNGFSTVAYWPNSTTGEGFSYNGGAFPNSSERLRIADRYDGASNIIGNSSRVGFRAVRSF